MSESLKSLLVQQAASVAFKPPDLDAIAHGHRRRVRRRRAVAVLAGVAAAAVVASTVAVLSGPANRRLDVVADPMPTGVSWAVGSTIHNGRDTVQVGHDVRAFVRTSVGFVTVDRANNVYSVTTRGVTRIGQAVPVPSDGTDYLRLVSDPHGTLAGWVGAGRSGTVLQVHDQATGQTRAYEPAGASGAILFAIDDRTAYWRAIGAGVFAVDVDTGDQRRLTSAGDTRNLAIWSVENGVLAFTPDHAAKGNVTSVRVGRSIDGGREFTFGKNAEADDRMRLSPTGAWLAYLHYQFDGPPQFDEVLAITAQVRDTATGNPVTLNLPRAGLNIPAVWLNDTTVQVLTVTGAGGTMYTCRVPDGSCAVAARLPVSAIEGTNLVLPNGQSTMD